MLKQRFTNYINAYADMNINVVTSMFADEILLRDWKISVTGKHAAVEETRKNFAASQSINIDILRLFESDNGVAGELKIVVNESEVLFVTDVITFDKAGKIISIRAYIGRDD